MCWCLCLTQFEWGQRGNESETEIPNEMRGNQRWTRRPHALPAAAARFVDAFERVSNDVGTPRCRRRRYPADRFYDLMRTRRDAGATRKSSPRPQSCAAPVVSRRLGPRLRPADRPKSAAPSQFAPLNNKSINSATVFQFFFSGPARRSRLHSMEEFEMQHEGIDFCFFFVVDTIPNEGIKVPSRLSGSTHTD